MADCNAVKDAIALQGIGWLIKGRIDAMKDEVQLFRRYKPFEKWQLLRGHDRDRIESRKHLLGDEGGKQVSWLMVCHDNRRAPPAKQSGHRRKKLRRVFAIEEVNDVNMQPTAFLHGGQLRIEITQLVPDHSPSLNSEVQAAADHLVFNGKVVIAVRCRTQLYVELASVEIFDELI